MDIEAPACVQQALTEAVAHNVYGYYRAPGNLYRAFMNWEKKYHGYSLKEEWFRFAPGEVHRLMGAWVALGADVPSGAAFVEMRNERQIREIERDIAKWAST